MSTHNIFFLWRNKKKISVLFGQKTPYSQHMFLWRNKKKIGQKKHLNWSYDNYWSHLCKLQVVGSNTSQ